MRSRGFHAHRHVLEAYEKMHPARKRMLDLTVQVAMEKTALPARVQRQEDWVVHCASSAALREAVSHPRAGFDALIDTASEELKNFNVGSEMNAIQQHYHNIAMQIVHVLRMGMQEEREKTVCINVLRTYVASNSHQLSQILASRHVLRFQFCQQVFDRKLLDGDRNFNMVSQHVANFLAIDWLRFYRDNNEAEGQFDPSLYLMVTNVNQNVNLDTMAEMFRRMLKKQYVDGLWSDISMWWVDVGKPRGLVPSFSGDDGMKQYALYTVKGKLRNPKLLNSSVYSAEYQLVLRSKSKWVSVDEQIQIYLERLEYKGSHISNKSQLMDEQIWKGVEKAYKRAALKYHPDKAAFEDNEKATEKFKTINDAYSKLQAIRQANAPEEKLRSEIETKSKITLCRALHIFDVSMRDIERLCIASQRFQINL